MGWVKNHPPHVSATYLALSSILIDTLINFDVMVRLDFLT